MTLDKSVVKQIAIQTGINDTYPSVYLKEMDDFAQAIYALGVADERARLAKMFDEAGWHPYAEVIRNSNNARMDCDSKSDK